VATGAALAVTALVLALTHTLWTDGARLTADFHNDAWYIQQQATLMERNRAPSLFLTSSLGEFYPLFAFYGGTLFVAAATIKLIVGSAEVAQGIVYTLSLGSAYGGWLWLARLAGIRSWPAHAAAILYVTAPYVLTNIYARQDLPESVATAAVAPLVASTISVLGSDRLRAGPAAALAASTIAFTGAHNITLLWVTTLLGLLALVFAVCVPTARTLVTRRGALRTLAVIVPALAVNAWYLIPDLAYHSNTIVMQRIGDWKALLRVQHPGFGPKQLVAIDVTPNGPAAYALPVLAAMWAMLAGLVGRARWRSAWGRTLLIFLLTTVAVVLAMTHPRTLLGLPDPWLMIQGSGRLETFALFGICAAVIAGLALTRGGPRWLTGLLAPALIVGLAGAVVQVRHAPLAPDAGHVSFDDSTIPFSLGDFADARLGQSSLDYGTTTAFIAPTDIREGRVVIRPTARPGDLLRTNVMAPAAMVEVTGARIVGRWAAEQAFADWQLRWYLTLKVNDDAVPGRTRIAIQEAKTFPIVGGRIISILGLLGLTANAGMIAVRARRPPSGRPRPRAPRRRRR
jgi:hypothetical protein